MLKPGQVVERYVVEDVVGTGGLAVVYRVRHSSLGSRHAMKVLALPDATVRSRLIREGQVQATLRHPNIVAVTDLFPIGDTLGLVMELVEGPTLDRWIRDGGGPVEEIERLFRGLAAGVRAAHEAGLIHRDIKPANVLLHQATGGLVPKVADFGLVHLVQTSAPEPGSGGPGSLLGSPRYMAPEQYRQGATDARADLFALGCVLYEMCCGKPAFDADEIPVIYLRITRGEYTNPAKLVPDLPGRFCRTIEACLQVDPAARPASVDALLALLDEPRPAAAPPTAVALPVASPVRPVPPPRPPDPSPLVSVPPARRGPSPLGVVSLVVTGLALAGVGWATWMRGEPEGAGSDAVAGAPAPTPAPPPTSQPSDPGAGGAPAVAPAAVGGSPVAPAVDSIPAASIPATPSASARPGARSGGAATASQDPGQAEGPPPATLRVVGEAESVQVVGSDGRVRTPGRLPPGRYTLRATFAGGAPVSAGHVTVVQGEEVTVKCVAAFQLCSREVKR